MQDMATARAARLSGRGRWAEKCRIDGRASCAAMMLAIVMVGRLDVWGVRKNVELKSSRWPLEVYRRWQREEVRG